MSILDIFTVKAQSVSHIEDVPDGLKVWLGPGWKSDSPPPFIIVTDPEEIADLRAAWAHGGHVFVTLS